MGIMNKMKTVRLRDLSFTASRPYFRAYIPDLMPERNQQTAIIASIAGFTPKPYADDWVSGSFGYTHTAGFNISFRDDNASNVTGFLASEGDKTITYETVDSVEEKIAGLKDYAVIKIDDTYNWRKSSTYNNTYVLYNSDLSPRPKDNVWRGESTRLYRSPWVKDQSSADIGTLNNGIYTLWTSTLYATVLSCNTLDEFKAYIKEHPIVIGYPTANGTHTATLITQTEEII